MIYLYMERKICRAEEEDIDKIVDLEILSLGPVWNQGDIHYDRENLKEFITDRFKEDRMLVIEEDGELLAFLHSTTFKDVVTSKKVCEVLTLTIHPDHFGEGLGGQIIEYERNLATEEDVDMFKIEVLSSNERAKKFYQKKGFSEKKKIMTMEMDEDKENKEDD